MFPRLFSYTIPFLLMLLAGCGGGGGGTPQPQPQPTPKTEQPAPTITLAATPASVPKGGNTTLTWSSSNTTSVTIDNGIGSVALSGSVQVPVTSEKTFTATASGAGGTATAITTVKILPAATVTLTVEPTTIKAGAPATLSWTSSNADSVTIDNGIGTVASSGSKIISPTESTTYTATASGPGGAAVPASASVKVVFPPTITLTASPATITPGNSTTLRWSSSNASSVTLDNNIGDEQVNGSITVSPKSTTIYAATATGPGGTATATFKVNVTNPPPPTVSLTVTPASINPGESATLQWTSSNGTSAQIDNGVGGMALNGSIEVSPQSTKNFTVTVTGGGGTATASASVTVGSVPVSTLSPLKHVIVVMMQNNSFDHLFGTLPAPPGGSIEGLQPTVPGYTQTDASGKQVSPFLLKDSAPPALPEGNTDYGNELNGGAMDKFAFYDGDIAMGYYDNTISNVGILWQLAQQFALADHYFGSVVGEAPTNQLYMVAAADLDRTFDVQPIYGPCEIADGSARAYTFPNVADQLSGNRLGWGVFEQSLGDCSVFMGIHNPFQFFTSTHDSGNIHDYSNFSAQLQNDILPAFSLVIPDSDHDMHPGNGSIANGITFLQNLVQQVQSSPAWKSTAIVITFDTGGGWYDHVPPPTVDNQGLAFRVPTLVISPYAKKNYVSHAVMDHVSVLKLIQWNWGLPSLNPRNAASGDMLDLFDFTQTP